MSDASLGLLPDLGCRPNVMRAPVRIIRVLVGVEIFFRRTRVQFACVADRAVRALTWIREDHIGAVRLQDSLALDRHVLGHAQRYGKSLGCAQHGICNSGVATGRVAEYLTRSEVSIAASFGHEVRGSAIFHRPAGIEPFGFAENLDARQVASKALKAQ